MMDEFGTNTDNDTGMWMYEIWAPEDGLWSPWAKPTLFMNKDIWGSSQEIRPGVTLWPNDIKNGTMVIIDLPGETGIIEGLSLCRNGWRPVPLYNGIFPSVLYEPVIQVKEIADKIESGAQIIQASGLKPDSPPAFLLDSRRTSGPRVPKPGAYDNRWCLMPQDMPSADFVKRHGIQRVVVRANSAALDNDLEHILKRYQQSGIAIFTCDAAGNLRKYSVDHLPSFRSLTYRVRTIMGLTLNSAGGFGGLVPIPDDSSSYRFG
jgi:hypothetical protein